MRLPAAVVALLLAACGAARPQAAQPATRGEIDTAPRPYSRACVEGCKGDLACQTCCALDALITWHEAPSEDRFCQLSHGCTDAPGRFIYAEAQQCGAR